MDTTGSGSGRSLGRIALLLAFGCLSCMAARKEAPRPSIVLTPTTNGSCVDVVGLAPDVLETLRRHDSSPGQELLQVHVGEEPREGQPAVAGTREVVDGRLRFVPRYPFVEGLSYRVVLHAGGEAFEEVLRIPEPRRDPVTRVTAIHPSIDLLPLNLLRLYVTFSEPMSVGEAYERIKLHEQRPEGWVEVRDAFLEIEQELWDPGRRRLTLLFDPGRIKRGLVPHEEQGLALVEGRIYRLTVDEEFTDGEGRPLASGFEKRFTVTGPDRESPDPRRWRVVAPRRDTREPVIVSFDEPLDHGLLLRLLSVRDERGRHVEGTIRILDRETGWSFVPRSSWGGQVYDIGVSTILEDPAGNSLRSPFDVEVGSGGLVGGADEVLLSFEPAG